MTLTSAVMAGIEAAAREKAQAEAREAARIIKIGEAAEHERVIREARRRVDAEERGPADTLPEILTLRERLAIPRPPTSWRITNWQPTDTRVMLAAQFKAGKTTAVGNVLRSLIDGDPWLGRDAVTPIDGTAVLADFEMSITQLDPWLEAQRIKGDDRVIVVPMRGHAAAFNILDADTRAAWVSRFRQYGASYLVLDCLRPILDALGLDEHRDAGRFLVAFDILLREAGITEALVVHHMGHLGERSRGDSRIRDWPDCEWKLVRQDDDPSSPRFMTAYGRDVDVPESQLIYDRMTRHLTIAGGSRKDAAIQAALEDVLAALEAAGTALSGRGIEDACEAAGSRHSRTSIREAAKSGIRSGAIVAEPGPKRATLHRLSAPVRGSAPLVRQCTVSVCAAPYREAHSHTHTESSGSAPNGKDDDAAAF